MNHVSPYAKASLTVSREHVDCFLQGEEVASALGHLGAIQQQVAIGPDTAGPLGAVVGPHGHMVVDEVRQVVRHQILP